MVERPFSLCCARPASTFTRTPTRRITDSWRTVGQRRSIHPEVAVEALASSLRGLAIGATVGDGADPPEHRLAGATGRGIGGASILLGRSHAPGDHFFKLVTVHRTHGGWHAGAVLRPNAVAGRR